MITYGNEPGIKVITEAGAIQGVELSREEKVVVFGEGNPSEGGASTNSPTKISSVPEAEDAFGTGTPLVRLVEQAIDNGVNASYLWGVMPSTQSVTGATFDASQSFTLSNSPIIEDKTEITVTDTVDSTECTVEFRYSSPPSTPSDSNTVYIRPQSGEVEADSSSDYEVDYKYLNWTDAFDAADNIVNEAESAAYGVNSDSESALAELFAKVGTLRDPSYKMVRAFGVAPPNSNTEESPPDPDYATTSYTDGLNSLPGFIIAPGREEDSTTTLVGALLGKAAGNSLQNPIRGEDLSNVTIESGVDDSATLDWGERDELRGKGVIPIKKEGSIRLDGNNSTDEDQNWETTHQTVRVVDQAVLAVYQVGQAVLNELDTPSLETVAAQTAQEALEDMADDGLLVPNTENETNLYVRPKDSDQGEIVLEMGITPTRVVDTMTTTIVIG